MIFWMGILFGLVFICIALKIGFFEIWVLLFNVIMATYLGIGGGRLAATLSPAIDSAAYGITFAIIALTLVVFVVLNAISYIFFTGQFEVTMPKICDWLLGSTIGFLLGIFVWSYLVFALAVSPISEMKLTKSLGFSAQNAASNINYLKWWCDQMDCLVGMGGCSNDIKVIIGNLVSEAETDIPNESTEAIAQTKKENQDVVIKSSPSKSAAEKTEQLSDIGTGTGIVEAAIPDIRQ